MRTRKPTVALIYDFDGTLSPSNMQEYDFLKAIDVKDKQKFWAENAEMVSKQNASSILCYMRLMLDKARAAHVSIKRQQFVDFGKSIELYKGVEEWFGLINELGKKAGVNIEHYIYSSGLREMIEGTAIAKEFKEIYACSFMYEDDSGFFMQFPAECKAELEKEGDEYELNAATVEVSVDTDKYYQ